MILICYDGSPDATAAIDQAAALMPGANATVLTLWEPLLSMMIRNGGSMAVGYADTAEIDESAEQAALATATEGAARATVAGLKAQPAQASKDAGTARTILDLAAAAEADVVVLGTRGLSGVKSLFLGSVSHEVVQHADRPVLVVPSPELSAERHAWSHRSGDTTTQAKD